MWSDSDGERELKPNEVAPGRMSFGSESSAVVEMAERDAALAPGASPADNLPTISQLNVSHKSKVHLGPKFVSVTQNVHNAEMVKTRFLGLELISAKNTLRCSIAVFVCWAFIVAIGLAFYLFQYTLPKTQTRLDLELPLPCYIWSIIKSTSRGERLCCVCALAGVLICLALILHFTRTAEDPEDIAPHEWNITREMWLAKKYDTIENTTAFEPLRLVVIQHTVSQECRRFDTCAAEMRTLQAWNLRDCPCDIAYNFLIGNDGRVYEGRGWGKQGAHTRFYNRCALGLGFVGDYREEIHAHSSVTELQINRTMMLLEYGVRAGYMHRDYHVIGAKDVQDTASPGSNLYNAIRKWEHYSHGANYRNRTCDQIYAKFEEG